MSSSTFDRRAILGLTAGIAGAAALPISSSSSLSLDRDSLTKIGATTAIGMMLRGELRAERYAGALLDQAERFGELNAFRWIDRESLLSAARRADLARDAGRPSGRLHGLPMPVKDSIDTAEAPTSNGTPTLWNFRPAQDAAVVGRLFGEGALLMGKTNLHELSFGWTSANAAFSAVRNAYDPERSPGGSSGGSASAVAACMAPIALAEDTWASIRLPAAFSGLCGFRPTWVRYPDDGIMPLTTMFDQVGPLARSVEDLVLFDAVAAADAMPIEPVGAETIRIGVPDRFFWDGLDPDIEQVARAALERLRMAGHPLAEVATPVVVERSPEIAATIISYEAENSIASFLQRNRAPVSFDTMLGAAGANVRSLFAAMARPPNRPSREVFEAVLTLREATKEAIGKLFADHRIGVLVFPVAMTAPPPVGEENEVVIAGRTVPLATALARNTALGSVLGAASLVLPAGLDAGGRPVGLEFLALPGRDRDLLGLGLTLQHALGPVPPPAAIRI